LVDAEHYLLACYRYIELNPVAAQMANHPGAYPWSSYSTNAYGKTNKLITPHPVYEQLGTNAKARRENYRKLFYTALGRDKIHAIRSAAQFSTPLGNNRFKAQIEKATGQKVGQQKLGRPFKTTSDKAANEN